jgi:Rps23 Pro-64 3,4-dihydroxylase Tpa1-like proline 4-hydroxylase
MNNAFISVENITAGFLDFKTNLPFQHCVVDEFLMPEILSSIQEEFLSYDSDKWFYYKNQLEDKKALNDWNVFPKTTYSLFSYLNSPEFVNLLSDLVGKKLISDPGLHGGGWHCHGTGGNLNPHFDYSIHPKLGFQRTINIIIYVSSELKPEHGGHLGLWEHDTNINRPGRLVKEIVPKANRAVIFNTTQFSWHGMSRPLIQPEGIYRKSLAIYYLTEPDALADLRNKALYAPRLNQLGDDSIEELITLRSGLETASSVYKK